MRGARGAGARRAALSAAIALTPFIAFMPAPSLARAAEMEVEVVSVTFVTTEQCPTREEFLSSVRRYTARWRVADAGESAPVRGFRITFDDRRSSPHGTLRIEKASGQGTTREIVANDCERVARGLAIAMALALDPEAEITAPGVRPAATVEAAPVPSEPPAPEPPVPPAPAAPAPGDVLPRAVSTKPSAARFQFGGEGRVELASTITGRAVPIVGASVVLHTRLSRVPGWLAPSFALGVRQSLSALVESPGGLADFSWTAAVVRACPVRVDLLSSRLELLPCAEGDVGMLQVEARATSRSATTRWFDLGGSLRALYRLNDAWGLGVTGLVTAPFVRHHFALDDGTILAQPPAVGFAGGLLAELRL